MGSGDFSEGGKSGQDPGKLLGASLEKQRNEAFQCFDAELELSEFGLSAPSGSRLGPVPDPSGTCVLAVQVFEPTSSAAVGCLWGGLDRNVWRESSSSTLWLRPLRGFCEVGTENGPQLGGHLSSDGGRLCTT